MGLVPEGPNQPLRPPLWRGPYYIFNLNSLDIQNSDRKFNFMLCALSHNDIFITQVD